MAAKVLFFSDLTMISGLFLRKYRTIGISDSIYSHYLCTQKQREIVMKKTILWIAALVVGAILGVLGLDWINATADFVATVYTRLFQLLAVPTIVLAVITTFATFGSKGSGRIFAHTLSYTLLTTFAAAAVGAVLYVAIAPGNLPLSDLIKGAQTSDIEPQTSYVDHILSIIPNNIIKPFLEGNVLSLLLLQA